MEVKRKGPQQEERKRYKKLKNVTEETEKNKEKAVTDNHESS